MNAARWDDDGPLSWVEVDLAAVRANVHAMRAALTPGAELIAVVKADAYGHGAAAVARAALAEGVRHFAVIHAREALELRAALPTAEILLMGPTAPTFAAPAISERITLAVVDLEHARALDAAAGAAGGRLAVHAKVDTGMGRLGFHWETAVADAAALCSLPHLEVTGVFTHFARVEGGADDPARRQMERFLPIAAAFEARARRRLLRHASNSAAFLRHPDWDLEAVRPGIALYGYLPPEPRPRFRVRPVLRWKTRVLQVRRVPAGFPVGYDSTYVTPAPTTLALLGVGYSDGYPRALSGRGVVLIGGRRCPLRGRVSMNWIAADAGPDARIAVGDEAVLIGRQGTAEIGADELARLADTISYELLTNQRAAVRRFLDENAAVGETAETPL